MLAGCFIGVDWKGAAQARHALIILCDLPRYAFSEADLNVHVCRQISCHQRFLTHLNLCHWGDSWRNKFHGGSIVWLSYEVDLSEFIDSIFCLDFGIAWHRKSQVLRKH